MALHNGQRLGPYEIVATLGAGGMGEVYKARDTRLERIVAIKVLPQYIAANPDLRARFEREARAISSLNHPNICALYDIGNQDGIDFLVMEYLEGETLAHRLKQGPMPVPELLEAARQIASALNKAHRQQLIHRDVKPSNVMLTKSGAKLLDFGLAKLKGQELVEGVSGVTRTTPVTGEGTIVGTLFYMAPETLEGKEADARSDIFSFGAMLYEMATGRRPFTGTSQASLIASIMKEVPGSVMDSQPSMPLALDRLIKKCLAKDPDDRWQSTQDLADELDWIAAAGSQAGLAPAVVARRRLRFRLAWLIAALSLCVAAAAVIMLLGRTTPEPRAKRFTISTPSQATYMDWPRISPDGSMLAFRAVDSTGDTIIWVRPIDSVDAHPLRGTDGSRRPFWSPDSRYLAYFQSGKLKKMPAGGGPAQTLCEFRGGADGSWGSGGIILFDNTFGDSIMQVPASGGPVTAAARPDSGTVGACGWPWFLPDGRHFIFMAFSYFGKAEEFTLKLGSLDNGQTQVICAGSGRAEYSASGYVLYILDGVLVARAFDADALKLEGDPIPIADNVSTSFGYAGFSTSDEGTLAYESGAATYRGTFHILLTDRTGRVMDTVSGPGMHVDVAFSPDGERLAYSLADRQLKTCDIWVQDLARGVPSRLTFDSTWVGDPVWSPDGRFIGYSRFAADFGRSVLQVQPSNGIGEPTSIPTPDSIKYAFASQWVSGNRLVVNEVPSRGTSVSFISTVAPYERQVIMARPFQDWDASLSLDGRYLLFTSDESGQQREIYVLDLEGKGKWRISTSGGDRPKWGASSREIFYVGLDGYLMSVPVLSMDQFKVGQPERLFFIGSARNYADYGYDVSGDGRRIAYVSRLYDEASQKNEFVVTLNWPAALKQK